MQAIIQMFSLPQKPKSDEVVLPKANLLDEALTSPPPDATATSRQPKRDTVASTIPPAPVPTVPVGKGLSKVTLVELMKAMGLMGLSLDSGGGGGGGDILPEYSGPRGNDVADEEDFGLDEDQEGSGGEDDGSGEHGHDVKVDVAYSASATAAQVPLTITGKTSLIQSTKSPSQNTTGPCQTCYSAAKLVEAVPYDNQIDGDEELLPQALVAENRNRSATTTSTTATAETTTKATATTPQLSPITTGTPSTSSTLATTSSPKVALATDNLPARPTASVEIANATRPVAATTTPLPQLVRDSFGANAWILKNSSADGDGESRCDAIFHCVK